SLPSPRHSPRFPYTPLFRSLICTGLAQLLWNRSLAFLNAGTCSMFYPLQPVTSTLFGVLFLGEKLTVSFLLGGAIIICGILISRSEEHTSELQSRFDLVCRL